MTEQQQYRTVLIVLMVLALMISAISALALLGSDDQDQSPDRTGGDFVLQSASGPVSLQQFRGQAVLIFFGYTHCPDVCPTMMSNVAEAMDLLSLDEQLKVQPLFITVDPVRDTAEHLAEYVAFFHPRIIGLSGTDEAIRSVAESFSVQFFRDDLTDAGKDNYLMNHTSYLFLIDPEGAVADMMSDHTSPQDIAKALRQYVSRLPNS